MQRKLLGFAAAALTFQTGVACAEPPEGSAFPSPYMDARDTPLETLDNGARVGADTAAYWKLPADSPLRASYDKEAVVKVADGIWTLASPSIVNVHVVQGPAGLIVYDTGDSLEEGERFYRMLRTATDAPIRAIIYSHEHYTKGTRAFVDAEAKRGNTDIRIIGNAGTNTEMARTRGAYALHPEIAPILSARALQQFNSYLPDTGPDAGFKNSIKPAGDGFMPVDTPVADGDTLRIAGLDLVFRTKGIETDSLYQLMVWIPARKAVLNNIVWGWFPNIYSVRGGGYRDPRLWRHAVDAIAALKPEILLSTHSSSLASRDAIDRRLADYRDAFSFILDQTLKGILRGEGPDELRYSVKLPPRLEKSPILIQNYGEVAHMPPRIYDAIFGQFDGDAAHLNRLHPADEARRMVEAMGGADAVATKITAAMSAGDYLWSCQLADYLVRADGSAANRQRKAACLREMGYRALATNSRSWYLSQARALEGTTPLLVAAPVPPAAIASQLADYVDYYRIRINAERSAETDRLIALDFGEGGTHGLHIRGGLVDFLPALDGAGRPADVEIELTAESWARIYDNLADPAVLIDSGAIRVVRGSAADAKQLFALFDPVYDWKGDPALRALAARQAAAGTAK
ncbi:alkyl sulfatase dimerization domain-containing protein [Sphingopyxis sp.]|uniref:alkyl sulfatase dimerization domain-containing protein n=1 Tax=Sphingopyxis sp. TaxID=1908224 RepID=UPI0025F5E594|nr:alkyl sulfatase dimerization domain-containing protein [Sphingopyxis sp.]MBR2172488.1 MBL fold metallo-hydrolase [Sphingopyxis sp.]